MESPADVDIRCSAAVFRDGGVLLVHHARDDGAGYWVLPGGTPHPGESMAACAQRETMEETGMSVAPGRVAFVLEALAPGARRRAVDLVFLAAITVRGEPEAREADLKARFVPVEALTGLALRPPLAGHLRWLHERGPTRTASYLGNMWRPEADPAGGPPKPPATP
ncbi:MAG TPA: NUDIX hydrolase [Trebonia sp.]|jgi:ADP-ribose pyrophosphatase YjhB (NUDIX family)